MKEQDILNDNIDKRIEQYVALRDKLAQMKEDFEKVCKPYSTVMAMLAGELQTFLDAKGIDSVKTKHGTCFKNTKFSATLADSQAFMDYVIQSERYELLDRKANVTAVKAFVKENDTLPPGCNLTAVSTVGVRRSGKPNTEDGE